MKQIENKFCIFYSRNPSQLKKDLAINNISIDTIILDFEYKKTIDFEQLASNHLVMLKNFPHIYSIYFNFAQCGLTNQKILQLLGSLPFMAKKLKKIHFIFDKNEQLGKEGIDATVKFLIDCSESTNFLSLSFKKCNLSIENASILVSVIPKFELVSLALNFEGNKLATGFAASISMAQLLKGSQKSLKILELGFNQNDLGDQGVTDFLQDLSELNTLSCLNLNFGRNGLTNQGACAIAQALMKCINVSNLSLGLDWNKIGSAGAIELAKSLKSLASLHVVIIDLNYNEIGASGAIALNSGLQTIVGITQLFLCLVNNDIGSEDGGNAWGLSLPASLQNIKRLNFQLGWNKITQNGAKSLAERIASYKSLQELGLLIQNNSIEDQGAQDITTAISKLAGLERLRLDLEENKASSKGLRGLLEVLKQAKNLQGFHLNVIKNNIKGDDFRQVGEELASIYQSILFDNFIYYYDVNQQFQSQLEEQKDSKHLQQSPQQQKITQPLQAPILTPAPVAQGVMVNAIQKFCELTRESIPHNESSALLSIKQFVTLLEQIIHQEDILSILFSDLVEEESNDFLQSLEKSLNDFIQNDDNQHLDNQSNESQIFQGGLSGSQIGQNIENQQNNLEFKQQNPDQKLIQQQSSSNESGEGQQNKKQQNEERKLASDTQKSKTGQIKQPQTSGGAGTVNTKKDNQHNQQSGSGGVNSNNSSKQGDIQKQINASNQQQQHMTKNQQVITNPSNSRANSQANIQENKQQNNNNEQQQNQQHTEEWQEESKLVGLDQKNSSKIMGERDMEDLINENNRLQSEVADLRARLQKTEARLQPDQRGNKPCTLLNYQPNSITVEKKMGVGSFGDMLSVRMGNQKYAMKTIEFALKKNSDDTLEQLKSIFEQVNLITKSSVLEGIAEIHSMQFDVAKSGTLKIVILSELMPYSLREKTKSSQSLNQQQKQKIALSILRTLDLLQKHDMWHGGLKPTNILLDSELNTKLCDLGISRLAKVSLQKEGQSTSVHGFAPKYSAPEIFDGKEIKTTDIWSFGCLLLHLYSGEVPWSGLTEYQQINMMYKKVTLLQHFKSTKEGKVIKLDPKIEEIIDKCTKYENRPLPDEVLKMFPHKSQH